MARGFSASEMKITAGPVAGLVSRPVQEKIKEQRTLYGSKYEENARLRQGWPSALTREVELRRTLALDPNAKFLNEKDDPDFELNQSRMEKMIWDMPVEVGVVYDRYNRLISITKGGAERVEAQALRSQFEGGTFIHNHPDGGPLSGGDLEAYMYYRPAEIIALSPEGKYSLKGMPDPKKYLDLMEKGGPGKVLTGVQNKAFKLASTYALLKVRNELSPSEAAEVQKAKTWGDLVKAMPEGARMRWNTIVNKRIGEVTQKELAKMGFEVSFSPNTKQKGYSSYDEIPTMNVT